MDPQEGTSPEPTAVRGGGTGAASLVVLNGEWSSYACPSLVLSESLILALCRIHPWCCWNHADSDLVPNSPTGGGPRAIIFMHAGNWTRCVIASWKRGGKANNSGPHNSIHSWLWLNFSVGEYFPVVSGPMPKGLAYRSQFPSQLKYFST